MDKKWLPQWMKRTLILSFILLFFASCTIFSACGTIAENGTEETILTKEDYALSMNTNFPAATALSNGNGRAAKVVLLLGQSNASGCSITEYLQMNTAADEFARLEAGFDRIRINYSIDDQHFSSEGQFLPVDLTCGCGDGFFGPEVGLADSLSRAFPDEDIFILKFTMSGYSLNHHWLYDGERAWIYDAAMIFIRQYMNALLGHGYKAEIEAILWMQGESDTSMEKAERYFDNQVKFVSYLRQDLREFSSDEIFFIDVGISASPYCEPGYPTVNEAKRRFAELSPYNVYFDTIERGLTTLHEPNYDPDLGHYDSLSELALGRMFGEVFAECMGINE